MDLKNILVLCGLLLNLFFALVIRFRSERSKANTIFEWTVYAISAWHLSMLLYRSVGQDEVNIWARFLYFFPSFIPTGFFLFGLHFPKNKVKTSHILIVVILNIIMATLCLLPGALIKGVTIPPFGERIIHFGWAYYYIYLIYLPLFFLTSYYILIRKYFSSDHSVRAQIHYILLGLILASGVGMVTNLALPTFGYFEANWMGQFLSFIWVGSATYAIVKHKLMDIKVITAEVLTFLIVLVLTIRIVISPDPSTLLIDVSVLVLIVTFGILLVRSVIREVKQREKLQELTEKLKALDEQKDTFISMAAHELRAPMTAIKGYVSMVMEGDTGDIPEKARGFLADASNITDRLVRLVNNMLNVSRIEEGRMVFQVETENLSQVVRAVFNQFVAEAERKNLTYKLEIPTEVKDMVEVDPDRIQEVIGNFLSNAIKYTDQGSVKVKLFQPKEDTIRCEVVDTGPGISKEEQSKLFQKFYRVESNVGKTTGTGLGLYIARLLVEKFGGKIGVISEVGKGSTFWFELPVVKKVNS